MFKILLTEEYEKDFSKLSQQEQERVTKILAQLREQGGDVGKPLSGLSFFREKKFDGKRLYYLIYKEFSTVLVVAISNKKAQQATINTILVDLVEYQQYVFNLFKNQP